MCRSTCCCRRTTRRNGARGSIRRRHGPVCRRRARSAAFRSRPGGPILPPARRWRLPTTKPETSFLCVADRHGNVFAATPSDPTIAGPVVPGTGITVSMWGSRGYTGPDHPARVGPGRRPRMSANPAIAIRPGEMVMPFGSPGSEVLGQAMVQVFLNQAVFGMDPQSACEAPRFASYSWPESALPHSYRPGHLCVEEDVGSATCEALAALGHRVERWPERKYLAGFRLHHPVRSADRREVGGRRSAAHGLRGGVVGRRPADRASLGWPVSSLAVQRISRRSG